MVPVKIHDCTVCAQGKMTHLAVCTDVRLRRARERGQRELDIGEHLRGGVGEFARAGLDATERFERGRRVDRRRHRIRAERLSHLAVPH